MQKSLLMILCATAALPLVAVEVGQSYEQVVAEKGNPSSKMQMGGMLILNYPDQSVKLREGKVIAIKNASAANTTVTTTPSTVSAGQWTTDYEAAMATARLEKRTVFLFFTGSDWCGWCQKLDKEILSTPEFAELAKEKLVLVKLDFPKAVPQSDKVKAQNNTLAERHNVQGYPTVILLNGAGKNVGKMGYQEGGPKPFVEKIRSL